MSIREATRPLRDAVQALDHAVSWRLPSCDPACYRTHSRFAPLVPISVVPVETPPPHWVPHVDVEGDVWLAVGVADHVVGRTVLPSTTMLEHVARQDTHTAYFQSQTEHLYRVTDGPEAGSWLIAVRDGEYGPVDLLLAGWLIVPVHPGTSQDLGAMILGDIQPLLENAIEEERVAHWQPSGLGSGARLAGGRSPLVENIVHDLLNGQGISLDAVLDLHYARERRRHEPPRNPILEDFDEDDDDDEAAFPLVSWEPTTTELHRWVRLARDPRYAPSRRKRWPRPVEPKE